MTSSQANDDSSSRSHAASGSSDESRRPVAIVSPQLPSSEQQQHGGSSSVSKGDNAGGKTVTSLDDFCGDEADNASYGLAVIAEDDEEDGEENQR